MMYIVVRIHIVVRIQQESFNEIKFEGELSVVDLLEPILFRVSVSANCYRVIGE